MDSGDFTEVKNFTSQMCCCSSRFAFFFLFSSTLGSVSNSPSSCFVASDGKCLRVFQAVIDARALLAEVNYAKCHKVKRFWTSFLN